ncbi:MAG: hypothetical protein BWY15_00449 [Firmicutes bacterium ADurb.Bin193]|nr:MAG: hypothetical protein BWY15_00449 [Firmicutes bacterium ADurb.Bin193]
MDVKQVLSEYMEAKNLTIQGFSEKIDTSRSTISQYLSGKYSGNIGNIERRIEDFLKSEGFFGAAGTTEIHKPEETPGIFITNDVKGIIGICRSCQNEQGLGAILGRSGYGKTYALKYYADKPKVIYMECDELMTTTDIITYIEKMLQLPSKDTSNWDRVNRIKDYFRSRHNQGYLMIFDEADKLLNKYTQKKLEIIRNIYDQSNVGIVIAGEPQLNTQLKKFSERFANRIDMAVHLDGLNREDVERYLCKYDITDEAMNEIVRIATNRSYGCFRILDRTIQNILRVMEGNRITLEAVEIATKMML